MHCGYGDRTSLHAITAGSPRTSSRGVTVEDDGERSHLEVLSGEDILMRGCEDGASAGHRNPFISFPEGGFLFITALLPFSVFSFLQSPTRLDVASTFSLRYVGGEHQGAWIIVKGCDTSPGGPLISLLRRQLSTHEIDTNFSIATFLSASAAA